MKIADIIKQGRQLYARCGRFGCGHRAVLDLTKLDPDIDHLALHGRLNCSKCGNKDVLPMPQTDRQMRQGRDR